MENYAVIVMVLAFMMFVVFSLVDKDKNILLPKNKTRVQIFGIIVSLISLGLYIGSIIVGKLRYESPQWGDSIGIPLLSSPLVVISGIIFIVIIGNMVSKRYNGGVIHISINEYFPKSITEMVLFALFIILGLFSVFWIILGEVFLLVSTIFWNIYIGINYLGIKNKNVLSGPPQHFA